MEIVFPAKAGIQVNPGTSEALSDKGPRNGNPFYLVPLV